jgi:beta-glucosidase
MGRNLSVGPVRNGRHMLLVVLTCLVGLYGGGCGGVSYLFNPEVHFSAGVPRELPEVFGPTFLRGVATSAYQIEGGNYWCDWYEFEQRRGAIQDGSRCGAAAEGWNRVGEDVALIKGLGANAYRFSIEWSRLEPAQGKYDEEAFKHYVDEVGQLRSAGITPMVTLLHFTLPQWVAQQGGLLAKDFPDWFAEFTREAARHFGGQVTLWCTINEPNVQMVKGYLDGSWPPGKKMANADAATAFRALLAAHTKAAAVLHREVPGAQVGVAQHLVYFEPRWAMNPLDWMVAGMSADAFNWAFYDAIATGRARLDAPGFPKLDEPVEGLAGSADFFGMNYYRRGLMSLDFGWPGYVKQEDPKDGVRNDLGWGVYPEGLLQLLRESWRRYKLPIYITENGMADSQGTARVQFLDDHLYAVGLALQEGIPVKGYFHWSLVDNFEWAEGYEPRFGLYRVECRQGIFTRYETPAVAEIRRLYAHMQRGKPQTAEASASTH